MLLAQSTCTCFSVHDNKCVSNIAGIKGVVRDCKRKSSATH